MRTRRKTCLGVGSWTYPYHCGLGGQIRPELAVEQAMLPCELIEQAKAHQLHCVQICENRPLDIYSPQELAEIRTFAENSEVALEVGMRGATRDNLEKMLEITDCLGGKLLRCVIDEKEYEPEIGEIIANMKSVLPILKRKQIVLGIENHDRFKAREFALIMKELNDRHYGIVLDTTNSLSQEEPVEEVLDWLAQYAVCLHFKDYTIQRSPGTVGLEIVGTPVGLGRQKVKMILRRLCEEAQQDFSTIIEFWMTGEADLERTLRKEQEWADSSVRYLKNVFEEEGIL